MKKLAALLALATTLAFAESTPNTHDGFFFNVGVGLGYGSFTDEIGNGDEELRSNGVQVESSIRLGFSVVQNLALHITTNLTKLFSDLEGYYEDEKVTSIEHDGFNTLVLGIGATFYIPNTDNIFASASFGVSDYSVTFDDSDYEFLNLDNGFAFNLMLGKEWWMSENLLMGVALSYTHSSADGEYDGYSQNGTTNTFSLLFSLTIN